MFEHLLNLRELIGRVCLVACIEIETDLFLDEFLEGFEGRDMNRCVGIAEGGTQILIKSAEDLIVPIGTIFTGCTECVCPLNPTYQGTQFTDFHIFSDFARNPLKTAVFIIKVLRSRH